VAALVGSNVLRTTDKPSAAGVARRRVGLQRALLHLPPVVWAYFDVLLVAATTAAAYQVLVSGNPAYRWVASPWLNGAAFCGGIALAGLVFGLYERQTLAARSRILVRTLSSLSVGLTLAFAVISLFFYGETTRWLGLCVAVAYLAVAIPVRLLAHEAVTSVQLNLLCLGRGESIRKVAAIVSSRSRPHHLMVGYLDVPATAAGPPGYEQVARRQTPEGRDLSFTRSCPRLGTIDDLDRVLRQYEVDEVVVDSELTGHAAIGAAVLTCLDRRCRVTDQATFVEKYLEEVPAETINAQWFLAADVQSPSGYDAVKRIIDVLAALVGLALTLPLWPLIGLLIRLDSRGPAIYRQARVGLHGRVFDIWKFRTMHIHAEENGARWAEKNDRRVTRVGRLLRRSRLDELPQLWNILCGEMSLVGPRPERPEFVQQLSRLIPHYRQRHLIKPGLTGWAQIRYGYGASVEDAHRKLCYDLYYLKHRSIDLDTAILIRTLGRFLLGAR